jgi:hypothetical protein
MPPAEYKQLVANLKRDGVLTSAPLVWRDPKTKRLLVLSGNHRVKAAREAEIEEADCIEVLGDLSPDRMKAIQLSHNAISGKDDPNVLAELYSSMDLIWKEYSGLSDELFKIGSLDIAGLALGQPKYEEIVLTFLPEDTEVIQAWLKRVAKVKLKMTRLVGHLDDFTTTFDSLIRAKSQGNIHNAAVALRMLVQFANERLDQLEAEDGAARS